MVEHYHAMFSKIFIADKNAEKTNALEMPSNTGIYNIELS